MKSKNTDEQKVLDARFFCSYKGVLSVKLPIGKDAFSFGILFIGNKVTDTAVIRHEYGHYVQLKQKGIGKYIKEVAFPSVLCYHLDKNNVLPYQYYGSPWEHEADLAGGVNRNAVLWPMYKASSDPTCRSYIRKFTSDLLAGKIRRRFSSDRK